MFVEREIERLPRSAEFRSPVVEHRTGETFTGHLSTRPDTFFSVFFWYLKKTYTDCTGRYRRVGDGLPVLRRLSGINAPAGPDAGRPRVKNRRVPILSLPRLSYSNFFFFIQFFCHLSRAFFRRGPCRFAFLRAPVFFRFQRNYNGSLRARFWRPRARDPAVSTTARDTYDTAVDSIPIIPAPM